MHFYTSITTCYLPKARVLVETLKKHNPDAIMHLVMADDLPEGFNLKEELFDYVWHAEDFIRTKNNKQWFYEHTVVELCTAIKPAAAIHIFRNTDADEIVFLDPDIAVYGNLDELHERLQRNSLLITPHQVDPAISENGVRDEEICSLRYGVFNFGFFAVRRNEEGFRFLNWWNSRLMNYCYDDIPNGLFTDQKWGNLIPCFFDFCHILRGVEYNVATWNLATRKITGNSKTGWFVNDRPLKFFHFTGFDSGAHRIMLSQHAKPGEPAWELSIQYENWLFENGQKELGKVPYKFSSYKNGEKILKRERILFRQSVELKKQFNDPFSEECLYWMKKNFTQINIKAFSFIYFVSYILSKVTFGKMRTKYRLRVKRYRKIKDEMTRLTGRGICNSILNSRQTRTLTTEVVREFVLSPARPQQVMVSFGSCTNDRSILRIEFSPVRYVTVS